MKKKILIVEDDAGILIAITLMLEDAGYEVSSVSNGQTLLKVNELKPDLLLLDIWMQNVDGRDVCRQLKNKNSTKHIPIIMVSARSDAEKSALDAGADAFIAKPFEMDYFLETINQRLI